MTFTLMQEFAVMRSFVIYILRNATKLMNSDDCNSRYLNLEVTAAQLKCFVGVGWVRDDRGAERVVTLPSVLK